MKITFLGTGTSQGVPVIACKCEVCLSKNLKDKRLRSSIMIEFQNKTIVVDTGPDFRQQMLRENVGKLDAVLFTHAHKDHVAGLDDIRSFNFLSKKPMEIYCTNDVLNALKMEYSYIFSKKTYPGVPKVNVNIVENTNFFVDDIEIQPIQALHYKLPVLGFRIKNFIYLTDLSVINSTEKLKMLNADVIVLDSLRKEPHLSHLSLDQSIALIKELKPKQAYLIHISHLMGLHDQVSSELPKNIHLSYDGLKLNV
jgi:phosphoribosyl 1,2-cyclic phosphate phosphodiesterase